MPTTKAHLSKLVTRLCSLPAQDKDEFGIRPQDIRDDLGGALMRFADSDEEATQIVDWLIFERPPDKRTYRPVAGEIPDAAEIVRERNTAANTPKGCEKCEGTGRVYVKRRVKDLITDEPIDVDCQLLCDCAFGLFLKAKDKETADAQRKGPEREENPSLGSTASKARTGNAR